MSRCSKQSARKGQPGRTAQAAKVYLWRILQGRDMALGTEACAGDMGRVWGVEGRRGGRVAEWCGVESGGRGCASPARSFLVSAFRPAPWARLDTRRSAAPPSSIALLSCSVLSCPVLCQRWRLKCRCACCATLAPTTLSRRCSRQRASGPRATRIVRARSVDVVGGGGWPTAN